MNECWGWHKAFAYHARRASIDTAHQERSLKISIKGQCHISQTRKYIFRNLFKINNICIIWDKDIHQVICNLITIYK